jgi:hypothetical protein
MRGEMGKGNDKAAKGIADRGVEERGKGERLKGKGDREK